MTSRLQLSSEDIVIIDRATGQAQAILENKGQAKVGVVIHADHFSEGATDEDNILWNNYYEYTFSMNRHIDFYVTATENQRKLLIQQFEKYVGVKPTVYTIPVGSLDELKKPSAPRKSHSAITASRLATEKHVDWLVAAVAEARKDIPDISLDIYGKGAASADLEAQIKKLGAQDYIHLMGQHNLDDVYIKYQAYFSASTSEGFGLTLMEAVGSGLPIIGFDVRYGNKAFIDDGKNGFRIPYSIGMESTRRQKKLVEAIKKLFIDSDMEAFSEHSYKKAKAYLTSEVESKWKEVVNKK